MVKYKYLPEMMNWFPVLQVKLSYQETELLTLLKKIPLGPAEMSVLRQRADQLKDGTIKSRGEALLPLTLASFIFDALCLGSKDFAIYWLVILSFKRKSWCCYYHSLHVNLL